MELFHKTQEFVNGNVPSYAEAFFGIKSGVERCHEHCNMSSSYHPSEFLDGLQKYGRVDWKVDLTIVGLMAIAWTVLRYLVANIISKPVARYFKLTKVSSEKFPESLWKLMFYSCTWFFLCHVIFGIEKNNHIFHDPETIWNDYKVGMAVDAEVYYIYMIELAFYVHSVYASLFLDVWRKDSLVMMFHHFLTISLIAFSYATRYHKIGLLVLFLHDVTDVILEFIKCTVYFKDRGGKFHKLNDWIANIGFVVFSTAWFLFRLYWFPLKVLYSCGYASMIRYQKIGEMPFYFFFNSLLWVLQILNIWWFTFIINMIIRVVTGQLSEIDDIREPDVDPSNSQRPKANGVGAGDTRQKKRKSAKKAD